jgi:hypothetical protein
MPGFSACAGFGEWRSLISFRDLSSIEGLLYQAVPDASPHVSAATAGSIPACRSASPVNPHARAFAGWNEGPLRFPVSMWPIEVILFHIFY